MRKSTKNQVENIFGYSSTFLITLLFVYTGLSKLLGHDNFVIQLRQISCLQYFAVFISIALPLLEISIVILINTQKTQGVGWLLATILMALFTIYVGGMLLAQPKLPCSCGGVIEAMSWQQHFWFNLLFFLTAFIRLKLHRNNIGTNQREQAENL